MALSSFLPTADFPRLSTAQQKALLAIVENFDGTAARAIKKIEKTTNHDVKAVEYYLKEKISAIAGLQPYTEFIHFGLTSEDVNNLAYGLLVMRALKDVIVPALTSTIKDIKRIGVAHKHLTILSLPHGQPATPSTLGKEMMVFVDRLDRQVDALKKFRMQGKFGGAVANYSAHRAAYPTLKWESFGQKFMRSLGVIPLKHTTQINPHDDIAELSHVMHRVNTISIDLARDIWSYISRGIFKQKVMKGEVGSSTMPHKVNPIDFENAEGNFGLSSALFQHFAEKLPISRLQRDLSDSTVQRNIGVAFGYHLLALASLKKGFSKLAVNKGAVRAELERHPEVFAEAIQMVLRKNKIEGAYEKLKEVTRGEAVSKEDLTVFVETLNVPEEDKKNLRNIMG